jgi:ribosome-associated protein
MDIRKLQRAIVDGLEDVKAQGILVFNTEHLSPLFERVIIASGTSNRQTKALASGVRESVKAAGFPVLATEGGDNGEWIIVDCGAAVAHIMQPAIRDYYRLEEIWGGKPVKMKIGAGGAKGLVKASEPDDDDSAAMAPDRKAAARKTSARKPPAGAAARPVAARKAVAKTARGQAGAAKPASARPVAARGDDAGWNNPGKTAPRKRAAPAGPVTQTVVVKAPARKTVAAKKAAPAGRKTAAAPRPASRKTSAAHKTIAARKTPVRRG